LITSETDTLNYGKTNSVEKNESVEKSHPPVINTDKAIIVSDLHLVMKSVMQQHLQIFLQTRSLKGIRKNIHYLFWVIFGIFGESATSSTRESLMKCYP
jgi:hypothetical protein